MGYGALASTCRNRNPLASASSLLTGLFAYWKMENVSDSGPNGLTLTNNNVATFTSGKVNNAVTLVPASSQYLSLANSATLDALEGHVPLTIALWFYPDGTTWDGAASRVLISRYGASFEWFLARSGDTSADTVQFCVENGTFRCRTTNAPTEDAWNFIVAQHDPTNDLLKIKLNGDAFDTLAFSNGMPAGINMGLGIGSRSTGADYFADQIDEVGIWTRLLSDAEITTLYNGGTGRTHPFS